jgi:lysophospholipase L1-like esterase
MQNEKNSSQRKRDIVNNLILILSVLLFIVFSEVIFRSTASKNEFLKEKDLEESLSLWNNWLYNGNMQLNKYTYQKEPEIFRIAALGDSFTYGYGTDHGTIIHNKTQDFSFPKKLEELLNSNFQGSKFEVLNFGIPSTNTLDQVYVLKHFILNYTPDVLILAISSNDYNSAALSELDPFIYCGLNLSFSEKAAHFLFNNLKLFRYIYTSLHDCKGCHPAFFIGEGQSVSLRCFVKSLNTIKQLSEQNGIVLSPIYILDIYYNSTINNQDSINSYIDWTFFNAEFSPTLKSAGFDSLLFTFNDLLNISGSELFADDSSHYSIKGNELIAKSVFNYMLENKLIPACQKQDCAAKLLKIE